jgi:hypothetical protein
MWKHLNAGIAVSKLSGHVQQAVASTTNKMMLSTVLIASDVAIILDGSSSVFKEPVSDAQRKVTVSKIASENSMHMNMGIFLLAPKRHNVQLAMHPANRILPRTNPSGGRNNVLEVALRPVPRHRSAPTPALARPGGHLMHDAFVVWPGKVPYVPTGHPIQVVPPTVVEYRPAAHAMQVTAPTVAE